MKYREKKRKKTNLQPVSNEKTLIHTGSEKKNFDAWMQYEKQSKKDDIQIILTVFVGFPAKRSEEAGRMR